MNFDWRYFNLLGGSVWDYMQTVAAGRRSSHLLQSQMLQSLHQSGVKCQAVCLHPSDKLVDAWRMIHLFKVSQLSVFFLD